MELGKAIALVTGGSSGIGFATARVLNQEGCNVTIAARGAATFGDIRIPADGKRLSDIEREALDLTLQLTEFNQSAAARILRITRPTLSRKLKAYGLARGG